MSRFGTARIALAASAAAMFTAACASEITTAPEITNPAIAGVVQAGSRTPIGNVEVCISSSSPAGNYTVTATGTPPATGSSTFNSPVTLTLPGSNCAVVYTRNTPEFWYFDTQIPVTVTVTGAPTGAGVTGVDCDLDAGVLSPVECIEPDGGAVEAVVNVSAFHGTVATFSFGAYCTRSIGWYKNQGSTAASTFDFDGGTDNGLTTLNANPKGNPYIILGQQYIAASLTSGNGAMLSGSVLTAFNNATTYLAAASEGNPTPAPYTKKAVTDMAGILENYNTGLLGTPHCK